MWTRDITPLWVIMLFDFHQPDKLREFLGRISRMNGCRCRFLPPPENHNTPRAYSRPNALQYVHYALAMSIVVPGIPFIHSGFELMETKPINTGLGFTNEMIQANPYRYAAAVQRMGV